MKRFIFLLPIIAFGFALFLSEAPAKDPVSKADSSAVDFEKDILPILKQNCFECHHENDRQGGLRFFGRRDLLALNDSGYCLSIINKLDGIKKNQPPAQRIIRMVDVYHSSEHHFLSVVLGPQIGPPVDGIGQNVTP